MGALVGCGGGLLDPSGPRPDESFPEIHGRLIGPAAGSGSVKVRWSADGSLVTFVSSDYSAAYAWEVSTGVSRLLYQAPQGGQIFDVQFTSDGEDFYTLSGPGFFVRRHQTSGETVETYSYSGNFSPVLGSALLIAPSQPTAAFVAGGRLYLIRRGAEPVVWGEGCDGLMAFSPDESEVVCVTSPSVPRNLVIFPGPSMLNLPAEATTWPVSVRWDETGIRILYWKVGSPVQLRLYQGSTGASATLATLGALEFANYVFSWVREGTRVAYWTTYCAQTSGLFSCDKVQALLYVLDVESGMVRRVAVHTLERHAGRGLALSPDGSTLAYVVGGSLYVLEVP
ncbi:MAG: hypothetical protein ACT4PM_07935 [Gemmatimonadales bacterium]